MQTNIFNLTINGQKHTLDSNPGSMSECLNVNQSKSINQIKITALVYIAKYVIGNLDSDLKNPSQLISQQRIKCVTPFCGKGGFNCSPLITSCSPITTAVINYRQQGCRINEISHKGRLNQSYPVWAWHWCRVWLSHVTRLRHEALQVFQLK